MTAITHIKNSCISSTVFVKKHVEENPWIIKITVVALGILALFLLTMFSSGSIGNFVTSLSVMS